MVISPIGILIAASIVAAVFGNVFSSAAVLPSPESVMSSYMNNRYIRFYEGSQGIAWTTVHPDGNSVSSYGTYVYTDGKVYRGTEGTTVIPEGVVSRKEVQGELGPGQHYYSSEITDSVIPVGRWVLSHREGECVHGPFSPCRDFEYYGIEGVPNSKCGSGYDSGWIAYCADCGQPISGYVYTDDICVGNIGYLFAGSGEFASRYPVRYLFFCPRNGDNLENDVSLESHMCKCFVSANRYTVRYNGNGAVSGSMPDSVFYYGGSDEYEGQPVRGSESLRDNIFFNPGFLFAGWSDVPGGEAILEGGSSRDQIEERFSILGESGDEADDVVVTLYAVWEKCDSSLIISGGYFREEPGAYNGVTAGDCEEGYNRFEKGYMSETSIDPDLLSHPKGYRIELNMMGGPAVDPIWTDTAFAGWEYTNLSGRMEDMMFDGRFTYIHSSVISGTVDMITAKWESIPVTLPNAVYPGYAFDGWYTDSDMAPEHFAGKAGDLYGTDRDTVLYAKFRTILLEAVPDYMGNDSFGEMRYDGIANLSVPGASGYDLFRYYISCPGDGGEWTEAVTEKTGTLTMPGERYYRTEGNTEVYTASRTGIYKFELWGGAGASYGGYAGENGEYSSCEILLNEGDVVEIYTGRCGTTETGENGTVCTGGEGSYIEINGKRIMSCSGGNGADHVVNIEEKFSFAGETESYTVEAEGDYKLEVWGARGSGTNTGHNTAGNGGYSSGTVHLRAGDILYICVGGMNGYNGGGIPGCGAHGELGGYGGGATHIALEDGELRNLSGAKDKVLIVAGGGGGSAGANASSGNGGGLTGGTGISPWPDGERTAGGGTQTSPGSGWRSGRGGFGYGGNGYNYRYGSLDFPWITNGGGGGGWYGGGGGDCDQKSYGCGGGGGSGYIGGVEDGTMADGVCGGNGHVTISCVVNVMGEDATGCGTDFTPGELLYRNRTVSVHDECIYPDEDPDDAGYCVITEPAVRYYGSPEESVYSPDKDAPDIITVAGLLYDPVFAQVRVCWQMPMDAGTEYSYMARAYRSADAIESSADHAQTDVKTLCITTGVYGYYYLIDTDATADKNTVRETGTFITSSWAALSGSSSDADFRKWYADASEDAKCSREVVLTPDGCDKYIHIISVDRAGNSSEVFNMAVDGKDAFIPYPVVTGKLIIRENGNVFRSPDSEDTYYVRADHETPFYLDHSSFISGYAREGYQIDSAYFYRSASDYAEYDFPLSDVTIARQNIVSDDHSRTPGFYLEPVSACDGERSDHGRELSFTGEFITAYEGELYIYPGASARLEAGAYTADMDQVIYSDPEEDRKNGLTVIGDATAPICYVSVNGSEPERLYECNVSNVIAECVIDRRQESVAVELFIEDAGSGVKEGFEIRICNFDNGTEGAFFSSGSSYSLELKMDPDSAEASFENMLFNGDFMISVFSEDNVGNRGTECSACLCELDVSGSIHRCLDELTGPVMSSEGERIIKRGESGYVLSDVWGYPDAVLVSFENEMLRCFDILYVIEGSGYVPSPDTEAIIVTVSMPEYMLEERTQFTVPLEYDDSVITVKITAFKDGGSITWETDCMLADEGTVLDELITVLR